MLAAMDDSLRKFAERARGFMPPNEGLALFRAGCAGAPKGPLLEIGSYCGKSAVYLGAAARECGARLFTIDHHRGSEEHQPGEEFHDPEIYDASSGRIDTLPFLLETLAAASLEDVVVPLVGASTEMARSWSVPLGLLFIDGGHSSPAAQDDLAGWAPHVALGGLLVIHDVFENPEDGGRPPYEIYRRALDGGSFVERSAEGSLRVLERVVDRV